MKPLERLAAALLLSLPASAQFDPPVAVDLDPDPAVVEVDLRAYETTVQYIPGEDTTVWTYNGSVPGPTIVGRVGNTLKVNFTNDLPEATTIHWHGLELPASMDGSHVSQRHVQPGETFTYEFRLLHDSLFWYHPHVRTFDQVEKGLYGCVLVKNPEKESAFGFSNIEEHVVVFDDVLLDAQNQVVPAFSFTDPLQHALYQLNGREGNVLLVNGKEASGVTLTVPNGAPQRWRVLNAANTTFCRLDINDAMVGLDDASLWMVGTDGGFLDRPFKTFGVTSTAPNPDHPGQALLSEMGQGILLLPGERVDVIFTPIGNDGESFRVLQKDWFRGRHAAVYGTAGTILLPDDPMDGSYPDEPYFELVLSGPDPGTEEFRPDFANPFPPLAPPVGVLPMTFGHGLPDPVTGDVTMFAQADFSSGSMVPLPTAKITSFNAHDVEVGETWTWEVTNLTHGDHPFHTHGFSFELLEYEFRDMDDPTLNFTFQPFAKRAIKDTIRVPARLGAKGRSQTIARLSVHFDDTGREGQVVAQGEEATFDENGDWISGGWLVHCHILEHAARGMLSLFEVRDPGDPFVLLGRHTPGTNGKPSLTANGDLSPGSDVTFELVDALPNTPVLLVVGTSAKNLQVLGGTLVPGLRHKLRQRPGDVSGIAGPIGAEVGLNRRANTDAGGRATIVLSGWETLDPGTDVYAQVIFEDPGAVQGTAFSNALTFRVP